MKSDLTIITIAYEESPELLETYSSIKDILNDGAKWILVVHERLDSFKPEYATVIIEGEDSGLYNALNLGLEQIKTDYYMLLHSGDKISDTKILLSSLTYMQDGYDCVLGGAKIGNRIHQSNGWKRWMLNCYVQPPHLPIIYKTASCGKIRYDTNITTVADFYYLKTLFSLKDFKIKHSYLNYIEMEEGGLTTSGIKSFAHVTFSFMAVDGIWPLLISPIRLLIKILIR